MNQLFPQTILTSSLDEKVEKQKLDYNTPMDQRMVGVLISEIEKLKSEVHEIKNKKIIDELQLPEDVLESSGYIEKKPKRLKRGRGFRPLLESEILDAKSKRISCAGQASYLGVSFATYKKYAQLYGLFEPITSRRGIKQPFDPYRGKYPIDKILNGDYPNYPTYRLKDLLIRSKKKKVECENCGFSERRITDNKIPLVLNFEDGNSKNHKIENLKLYCYNCTFLIGRGYVRKGKKWFDDPDRLQGAQKSLDSRF